MTDRLPGAANEISQCSDPDPAMAHEGGEAGAAGQEDTGAIEVAIQGGKKLGRHDPSIVSRTAEIKTLERGAVRNAIESGGILASIKADLAHGEWLPWLEENFDWSEDTAHRLMQAHKEFGGANSAALRNLSGIGLTTLYRLAAPSTPAPVREKVLDLAATEVMDRATVKTLIAEEKKKARAAGFEAAALSVATKAMEERQELEAKIAELQKQLHAESERGGLGAHADAITAPLQAQVADIHKQLQDEKEHLGRTDEECAAVISEQDDKCIEDAQRAIAAFIAFVDAFIPVPPARFFMGMQRHCDETGLDINKAVLSLLLDADDAMNWIMDAKHYIKNRLST